MRITHSLLLLLLVAVVGLFNQQIIGFITPYTGGADAPKGKWVDSLSSPLFFIGKRDTTTTNICRRRHRNRRTRRNPIDFGYLFLQREKGKKGKKMTINQSWNLYGTLILTRTGCNNRLRWSWSESSH